MKEIIHHYTKDILNYLLATAAFYSINLLTIFLLLYVLVYILPQPLDVRYKIMFLSALILFFFTYRYARKKSVDIAENVLGDLRQNIIENIRNCDLQSFEKIDKSGGYNAITLETQIFSENTEKMFQLIEEIFFTISVLILILIISPLSGWLVLEIISAVASIYAYYIVKAKKLIHEARNKELELLGATGDVIKGFKDLKLNDQKNDDFYHHYLKVKSADNRKLRIEADNYLINSNVYSMMIEYCIFLPIIFVLPYMGRITLDIMMATMTLILFISFNSMKSIIPFMVKLGVSIERLIILDEILKQLKKETLVNIPTQNIWTFKEIKFHNICFEYLDKNDHSIFSLKNISFSIYPEEVIFIKGGNGSGKSTLLKVITGLYSSSSGCVYLDAKAVDIKQYRYLFSAIFTDFHLFDRLYGLPHNIDLKKFNNLLEMMKLNHKLTYNDNRFTRLELSSGQKKRLVVSLMEDRPIYIFDEWAADQMPHFMDYFYYYLLPDLRNKGKSVIAVTHDEDYFHTADRLINLDYGHLKSG